MSALTCFTTVEFTINAGTGARVRLDPCPTGVPYIVIDDGSTEVTIKPAEDEATPAAVAFACELVGVALQYANGLRAVRPPQVPCPIDAGPDLGPVSSGKRVSSTSFEFTINAGSGARVHLDTCGRSVPYLAIEDGPVAMMIKPADGDVCRTAITFADQFVEVAGAYETGLVEALARSVGS